MRRLKDAFGTLILFLLSLATAWLLTKWPMSWDRALLITALAMLAQLRWYQDEKSPLGKSEKP